MLRCNSMNCNDPNATHHAACDCRETAHAAEVERLTADLADARKQLAIDLTLHDQVAELADARLMLRALTRQDPGDYIWHASKCLNETLGRAWRWRRGRVGYRTTQHMWEIPRTGPVPEINDEVRDAMRASLGES